MTDRSKSNFWLPIAAAVGGLVFGAGLGVVLSLSGPAAAASPAAAATPAGATAKTAEPAEFVGKAQIRRARVANPLPPAAVVPSASDGRGGTAYPVNAIPFLYNRFGSRLETFRSSVESRGEGIWTSNRRPRPDIAKIGLLPDRENPFAGHPSNARAPFVELDDIQTVVRLRLGAYERGGRAAGANSILWADAGFDAQDRFVAFQSWQRN